MQTNLFVKTYGETSEFWIFILEYCLISLKENSKKSFGIDYTIHKIRITISTFIFIVSCKMPQ